MSFKRAFKKDTWVFLVCLPRFQQPCFSTKEELWANLQTINYFSQSWLWMAAHSSSFQNVLASTTNSTSKCTTSTSETTRWTNWVLWRDSNHKINFHMELLTKIHYNSSPKWPWTSRFFLRWNRINKCHQCSTINYNRPNNGRSKPNSTNKICRICNNHSPICPNNNKLQVIRRKVRFRMAELVDKINLTVTFSKKLVNQRNKKAK